MSAGKTNGIYLSNDDWQFVEDAGRIWRLERESARSEFFRLVIDYARRHKLRRRWLAWDGRFELYVPTAQELAAEGIGRSRVTDPAVNEGVQAPYSGVLQVAKDTPKSTGSAPSIASPNARARGGSSRKKRGGGR